MKPHLLFLLWCDYAMPDFIGLEYVSLMSSNHLRTESYDYLDNSDLNPNWTTKNSKLMYRLKDYQTAFLNLKTNKNLRTIWGFKYRTLTHNSTKNHTKCGHLNWINLLTAQKKLHLIAISKALQYNLLFKNMVYKILFAIRKC